MRGDPFLIANWLKGWTLARETAAPVADHDGWRVDVNWPDQLARYVFAAPGARLKTLAQTITEPLVYLKVCAPFDDVKSLFPSRWEVEPRGFIMTRDGSQPTTRTLQKGYELCLSEQGAVTVCTITAAGEQLAIGRVAIHGDCAIYDRIVTHEARRRQGLGNIVMLSLHEIAAQKSATRNVLCATAAGRGLYETLGWQVHSPYTSAVIPK